MNQTTMPGRPGTSRVFRVLWAVDALTALICVAFFFIGLADGSVSSFNIGLWVLILFGLGSVLFGSYGLHVAGFKGWALFVAAVVAVPSLLFGFFFLLILVSHPRWN